jgi:hypothetical protein
MKHRNKYALALVLLASYVFAVEGSGADKNPSTEIPENAVETLPDHDHSTGENENKNKNNLNDWQRSLIKAAQEAIGKSLSKDQLNEFLNKHDFNSLDAEIRAKAILVLAKDKENWHDDKIFAFADHDQVNAIRLYESKNGKIPDEEFIIKILNSTGDELKAISAGISDSPDTLVVTDENKIDGQEENTNNLNDWQRSLIKVAQEALGKSLPEDQLNKYLSKNDFNSLDAEIRAKAILVLAKDKENWHDDKIFAFADHDQVNAIRLYESKNGKIPDEEFIIKILNSTGDELKAISAGISDSPDASVVADENTQNEKKSSQKDTTKSKEDETTKRITEDELVAATKARDAAAQRQLSATASTTPPASDSKGADLNGSGSGSGDKSEKAEVPFYKNAWIMVPSGVILLSVIGGGVFMMTRKTEETDL